MVFVIKHNDFPVFSLFILDRKKLNFQGDLLCLTALVCSSCSDTLPRELSLMAMLNISVGSHRNCSSSSYATSVNRITSVCFPLRACVSLASKNRMIGNAAKSQVRSSMKFYFWQTHYIFKQLSFFNLC